MNLCTLEVQAVVSATKKKMSPNAVPVTLALFIKGTWGWSGKSSIILVRIYVNYSRKGTLNLPKTKAAANILLVIFLFLVQQQINKYAVLDCSLISRPSITVSYVDIFIKVSVTGSLALTEN